MLKELLLYEKALCLIELWKYDEAIQYLNKAVQIDENYALAYF